ncbi:MAG: pantetheine-phosphate adenylyltransferase [Eubacterium sp.]|nr:pantetheine-phosphate adenylyltransferase [Eubacterium sp.]
MSIVVYPGSFDPVTVGHMDLIRRAAGIFDQVIVGVLVNSEKKSPLFSLEERVIMLKDACKDLENVSVENFEGLLIDFVRAKGSKTIIRGLRELMDFEMELQMAQVNRVASGGIETLFLPTDPRFSNVSSSVVREYARYGVKLPDFVPGNVLLAMEKKGIVKSTKQEDQKNG